ncbi:MAG: aminotransferase class V-fold PLP-dependent enzyme, partial [bacterium]|nr:aminotransferase class V-fold PLP-dependent enzyme [bacterium]
MRKKVLYLDYAASTPVDPGVLAAMMPYLKQEYGNPSSLHHMGQKAASALERARVQASSFLHCAADEVVFTSGATEANNLVIRGATKRQKGKSLPHVVISAIEHESVLSPCRRMEQDGLIELTILRVDKEGVVEDVSSVLKDSTQLVSIQYANSEIGTVQQIAA